QKEFRAMLQTVQAVPASATAEPIAARAARAAAVAAQFAAEVDRDSRFPQEAMDALKAERLLGILVPTELGGEGASVADVVDVCYALGRACSSTGMIYAMHQVKAACVVNHGQDSEWMRGFMTRMVEDQ